jgi:hypothetical protein
MSKANWYWWKSEDGRAYESIFPYIKHLNNEQGYRQADNFKNMRLYGSQELYGMRSYAGSRGENSNPVQNRITLNIVQSMVDTVVSKISKNKPKPTFLTEGGDWSQQSRAKKLTQFLEGQFQSTEFYEKAARAFLDSCIFGTGALKIFTQDGKIKVERVFIDEIILDDKESLYGEPRQMHQHKMIHKDVLKDMFPKFKEAIELAGKPPIQSYGTPNDQSTDMVMVVESWHLQSGPDAGDGKHVISIENEDLFSEEYTKDYFPFVFWRWGIRPLGFFGQGLSEQLTGLQLEINKILKTIQISMHLVSVPKVFVEASSKIVSSQLDNKIGAIIKYAGTPPTPGQLGVIPPELFAHLDRLYSRAYEIAGVSQLSATAQKPSGLNSGKALREYNDLETERFMSVAQRYEKVFLDAGRIMISLAKDLDAELDTHYEVKVKGKKFLKTIKWKEVDMEEDQYVMSLFPTSALSSTPAGRLQDIQELIQAGFVSREDAMKLLDFPDLQGFYNYETAPGEDIDMVIEKIVEDSDYMTPEPYQNLEYGIQKMQKAYLLFRSQNLPESKLELIRRWIEDANALIERASVNEQRIAMEAQAQTQASAASQAALNAPQDGSLEAPPENPDEAVMSPDAAAGLPVV